MKKSILFLTTMLCVVFLHAQTNETKENNPYNLPLSNEEFFKQAEIVFEGYFIKIVAGYNLKGTEKYSDGYKIAAYKVQRIYKGTQFIEGDTIYITHPGGLAGMENDKFDDDNNYIPSVLYKNGIYWAPQLRSPTIYFLESSNFPDDENSKYFAHKKYKFFHKGRMYIYENTIIGLNDLIFRERDDFYDYMRQFEGFTVPEQTPQPEKQKEINENIIDNNLENIQINIDSLQYEIIKESQGIIKKK